MMYHQTNLGCKSVSTSEDLIETIVPLTLNRAKLYFCMILWLMMMHHHTKFNRSEILSGQTATRKISSKLTSCGIDLEHSDPIFSLDTSLLMMIYHKTEFGCKRLTGLEFIQDIVKINK